MITKEISVDFIKVLEKTLDIAVHAGGLRLIESVYLTDFLRDVSKELNKKESDKSDSTV